MAETSDDELLQIDNRTDTWPLKMTTPSDFQRLYNVVSTNITKITANTTDLEKLVQKLGTQEDSEQLRERYLRLQDEIKVSIQQTNATLKQLQSIPLGNAVDQRQRKNITEILPKQYLTIIERFREAQQLGARKEKESLERARAVSYRPQNTSDSEFGDNFAPSNNQYQQQIVLPMEQEVDIQGLRERDDQLRQLETNIVVVSELFKDVARIVNSHGEIVDTIGAAIVDTERNVDISNQKLISAVDSQTSARRKKILIWGIVIVVLVIVGLVVGIYFGVGKG